MMRKLSAKVMGLIAAVLVLCSMNAQAVDIGLDADAANSTLASYSSSVAYTIDDPFAYDRNNPTSPMPENDGATTTMYHASLGNNLDAILSYTLTDGAYTVVASDEPINIDLYGRDVDSAATNRDDNIKVVLYNGDYITPVATVTNLGIFETFHVQGVFNLSAGTQFDRVQVIGHDSDDPSKNYFTLIEIRASTSPVIGLDADATNSSAGAWGTHVTNTLTDGFSYNPDAPTAVMPSTDLAELYHAYLDNDEDATLSYTLSAGTHTVGTGGEDVVLDLYGRHIQLDRDDNIEVMLYNGDYSTVVATLTGLAIDDTTLHARGSFRLAAGTQFDRIRIIGHDSDATATKNYFTLAEVRLFMVPLSPFTSYPEQDSYPSISTFVQSTLPLSSFNLQELEAHYTNLLNDIGGWSAVASIMAIDVWPCGYNYSDVSCPTHGTETLDLVDGELICTTDSEVIYPSATYAGNHAVHLSMNGGEMDFSAYRSATGKNYFLESVFDRERLERLYGVVPVGTGGFSDQGLLQTLSRLYEETAGEAYATKCVEIILGLSQNQRGVHLDEFTFADSAIPSIEQVSTIQQIAGIDFHAMPAVQKSWILAFETVRNATNAWAAFGDYQTLKDQVKQSLIDRHENFVAYAINGINGGSVGPYNIGNIFADRLGAMAETAVYCDYPKALFDCASFAEGLTKAYSTFNGVEAESVSYQAQVIGHMSYSMADFQKALTHLLDQGLLVDGSPAHLYMQEAQHLAEGIRRGDFQYPNGEVIRLGDTTINYPSTPNTVWSSNEKDGDNAWALFPTISSNRTYLGLSLSPKLFSHHHQDDLSIVLWGSGKELLPKYGYIKANYRYFATSKWSQNGSGVYWLSNPVLDAAGTTLKQEYEQFLVNYPDPIKPALIYTTETAGTYAELITSRKDRLEDYKVRGPELDYQEWRRTAVYEYTPEGLVTSVDAASPGPVEQGVGFRNRLLMTVPVHGTSSYVADFHRIAGGDAHQIGIQAPFNENSTATYSAAPTAQNFTDLVSGYLDSDSWGPGTAYFINWFRNPQVRDGSDPWTLEWLTAVSGVRMKIWGDGSADTVLLTGETPDPLRDPNAKVWGTTPTHYVPHFYVRHESSTAAGNLKTVTPLVYEHDLVGQTNVNPITDVETVFYAHAEEHKKPLITKITFASGRIDYLYSSYDTQDRTLDGLTFNGRGAWVSTIVREGQRRPWGGTALRDSSIRATNFYMASAPSQNLEILEASSSLEGENKVGQLRLSGIVSNPAAYAGVWAHADFGEEVSNIYKITGIEALTNGESMVTIEGAPGLEKGSNGYWAYPGYPFKEAGQQAYLQLDERATYYSKAFLDSIEEAMDEVVPVGANILPIALAPVFNDDPISTPSGQAEHAYSDTLSGRATSGLAGDLTYSKLDGPAWLSIAADGTLSGTPVGGDVGPNSWTIQVSDADGWSSSATLDIVVEPEVNTPPSITGSGSLQIYGFVGHAHSSTLAGSATDVDYGHVLTYSMAEGPAWLMLDADGSLRGTPSSTDVGEHIFTVQVSDGHGGVAMIQLFITVHDDVIAYEGFDTSNAVGADASAAGVTGVGFTSYTNTHEDIDLEAGLGYTDGQGNTLESTGRSAGLDVTAGGTQNLQLVLDNPITNGTVYMSFLLKADNPAAYSHQAGVMFAYDTDHDSLGQEGAATVRMGNTAGNWYNFSHADGSGFSIGGPVNLGLNFVVAKIDYDADTMTTYWNPGNLTDVAGTAQFSINATADAGGMAEAVGFGYSLAGAVSGLIDEIRLGNTIEVVVPIVGVPADPYGIWGLDQGLTSGVNDALTDDPDSDGNDNLMEYAVNGDPLVADAAALMFIGSDGGVSNWLYHVHNQRTDDGSLTYTLELDEDLVSAPTWAPNGVEFVGESASVDHYKSVTNRTDVGNQEFIRLKIDRQ